MRKFTFLLACMLFMVQAMFAQRTITGTVTNADDGNGIPGVSVRVKGTTIGAVTDLTGKYTLAVPEDALTLIFSYVGMVTQEVAIEGKSTINVVLNPDVMDIEGVVVTALGISREKKSLGYAVQDVKSEELTRAASANAISSLSGKIAGVQINQIGGQIGAASRIVIRGNSSFGDNEPLVVVDGIPVANDSRNYNNIDYGKGLYDINPQDIESISVLKGGAAAALYGMRAGHGVILITTKRGSGKAKGISVEYDGNFNVDQVYSIQKWQNKYGQGYYGSEYYWKYFSDAWDIHDTYQKYAEGGYHPGIGFSYKDGIGGGVNDNMDASWGPRLDIGLKLPQYNSPKDANGNRIPTDWVSNPNNVNDFYQLGHSTNHNISLVSVGDNSRTRLSMGVRNQAGVLPNTDLTRYTTSVNSIMDLGKKFQYDLAINYARSESGNLPETEYNASNPMQAFGQWFGRQIDMKDLKDNWETTMDNGFPYNWNSSYHNNPYWSMYKNTNDYQRDRAFGKTSLYYMPTSFLKFEGRIGLDFFDSKSKSVIASGSNETLLSAAKALFEGGSFRLRQDKNTEFNADFIAYFNKSFLEDKISLNLLAGANYRNLKAETSVIGADVLTVPDLFTVSNAKGSPINTMSNTWIRSNSVYASGSLGYDGWVYLDASMRKDWSSTLKEPFFYPAFSLSVLPFEAFDFSSNVISFLKLRGGWSKVGSATGAYRLDPYFSAGTYTIYGVTQFNQATEFPPASLRPEQVVTTEFGLEANFLQNRIGLDFAIYDKTTTDQIMSVAISKATGYNTTLLNAGEINNKGVEVMLRGSILKSKTGLNWDLFLNWARDVGEIVELYTDPVTKQELLQYNIGNQWSTYVQARPGMPWGVIFGTGMLRTADGSIIVDEDGIPMTKANIKLGEVTPKWIGGLRNEFTYKNLSFGFLIDIRKGGDIFSVSHMFGAYSGMLEFTAFDDFRENGIILGKDFLKDEKFVKIVNENDDDILLSEFAENDIVTGAQDFFESYYANRELSVYDGSYGKLREAHITYMLPKNLFGQGNFVKGGSVSLVGTNLAILWRHKSNIGGFDPETTTGTGNASVGLESTSYPPSRSFGIKLNLKF
ncbi:MAG: SusC/RagA family TonB-linked outer membrane protein [Bacteroidales bacterium]